MPKIAIPMATEDDVLAAAARLSRRSAVPMRSRPWNSSVNRLFGALARRRSRNLPILLRLV